MKHEKLPEILSELREGLRTLYGERLVDMVLFGSQARGDAAPGSDIDVMIVLKGDFDYGNEIEETSQLISDLSLKYDTLLSRIFVSKEKFRHEQSPLLINVRREGISILHSMPDFEFLAKSAEKTAAIRREKLKRILPELRERLIERYDGRLVDVVFLDSQAQGETTPSSGIDVMVVLRGEFDDWREIEQTSALTSELCLKYDEFISKIIISEDEFRNSLNPLLIKARREGVSV